MKENQLSAKELRRLLDYNPESGIFTRLIQRSNMKVGSVAGSIYPDGYAYIMINRERFLAHRLAWLYMTGSLPQMEIDHIDRDRSNNSWVNLRSVSTQQNSFNRSMQSNNKTGYKGVSFSKRENKFRAVITLNGKLHHLGYFSTAEEASQCYQKASLNLHGEHSFTSSIELVKQREAA